GASVVGDPELRAAGVRRRHRPAAGRRRRPLPRRAAARRGALGVPARLAGRGGPLRQVQVPLRPRARPLRGARPPRRAAATVPRRLRRPAVLDRPRRQRAHFRTKVWTLEYAVSFADIWASESYKAAGLPEKAPVLALVHPKNPDMVYFFVKDQLVGVDLRAKEVLEYETHKMTVPENARVFSYGLLPMELPPALSAGLSKEGAANNSSGVRSASLASPPSDPNGS
uniref:DUF1618 domain-containing protein n=1 Tax=Oryza glaberrima TaxID=4538 RepID=I1NLQ7_ORYGL